MSSHCIRLRRPWQFRPEGAAAVWSRRFHRPTGLGPGQRVFVVVEGLPQEEAQGRPGGEVRLNGRCLGRVGAGPRPLRFDVTGLIEDGNELVLRLEAAALPGAPLPDAPPGDVSLEITS